MATPGVSKGVMSALNVEDDTPCSPGSHLRCSGGRDFLRQSKALKETECKIFASRFSGSCGTKKGVPILTINIEKANDRAVLEELLCLDKVLYVHLAPPCGTASAARNIQPGPPPLRSIIFPVGLPHLSFVQRTRVSKANFLYAWTCKIILIVNARNIGWRVENPASSLLWITDPFVHLLKMLPDLIAFSFHTYMFAAQRKKDTAIWTCVPQLRLHVERKCDGLHEHLRWGKTATSCATAEECAYNDTLCAAWAEAIFDFAISWGYVKPPETVHEIQAATAQAAYFNKAILGCLPRGRKLLPFISEILQPATFDISSMPLVQTMVIGKRIADDVAQFPKGSKLLRFDNVDGGIARTLGSQLVQSLAFPGVQKSSSKKHAV